MKTEKVLGIHDKEAIAAMLAHIESECSKVDTEELYDQMLDECSECCAMCQQYGAAHILKELDPTAYRCGHVDYVDSLCRNGRDSLIEIGSDYYQGREVDDAKEEFIDGLRDELKELKSDDAILGASDEHELAKLNDEITRKESAIEACEDYAF